MDYKMDAVSTCLRSRFKPQEVGMAKISNMRMILVTALQVLNIQLKHWVTYRQSAEI